MKTTICLYSQQPSWPLHTQTASLFINQSQKTAVIKSTPQSTHHASSKQKNSIRLFLTEMICWWLMCSWQSDRIFIYSSFFFCTSTVTYSSILHGTILARKPTESVKIYFTELNWLFPGKHDKLKREKLTQNILTAHSPRHVLWLYWHMISFICSTKHQNMMLRWRVNLRWAISLMH